MTILGIFIPMGLMKLRSDRKKRRPLGLLGSPASFAAPLPLVHVTATGAGRQIIEQGQIEMRPCKLFGTNLTYFFLLRPAYRLKDGSSKSDEINRFPFVIFVSPRQLGDPYHVYPFDTGGAADGVFDERADKWVALQDYELDPSLDSAARFITWAFGGLSAYLDGNVKQGLLQAIPHWEDVARAYLNIAGLAASGGHNQPDKRASAVEVAYRRHIPLKGNAMLSILPKQYLEDGKDKNSLVIDQLNQLGLPWETYDWQPNKTPDEFQDEILTIARQYFTRLGIV
jgi:hypothetical protein